MPTEREASEFRNTEWVDRLIFVPPDPAHFRRLIEQGDKQAFPFVEFNVCHQNQTHKIALLWFGSEDIPEAKSSEAFHGNNLILFFHGNTSDVAQIAGLLRKWHRETGFQVIALEYPGYGTLDNVKPSQQEFVKYVRAAIAGLFALPALSLNTLGKIWIVGQSMGTSPALIAALCLQDMAKAKSPNPPVQLVLISSFASIRQLTREHFHAGMLPDQTIERARAIESMPFYLDNLTDISGLRYPCLFIHGTKDQFIPIHHAESLLSKLQQNPEAAESRLVALPGVGHSVNLHKILLVIFGKHVRSTL